MCVSDNAGKRLHSDPEGRIALCIRTKRFVTRLEIQEGPATLRHRAFWVAGWVRVSDPGAVPVCLGLTG